MRIADRLAVAALVATLAAAPAAAALEPAPFEAVFDIQARGFTVAESRWRLSTTPDGFVYEQHGETVGIAALLGENRIEERSEWRRLDGRLRPVQYRYERVGRRNKSIVVDFDWDRGEVRNTRFGQTTPMPVPPDTVDQIGYVLALMEDLRRGETHPRYHIVGGKDVKLYEFTVMGRETVDTALGEMEALRVERNHDTDRETTIWFAPSLDFCPVRLEHRERDGEHMIFRIRSLRPGPAPP